MDSVNVAFGLANLIEKKNKNQLTELDVVQFSMSIFFFGHTLIQPKTAYGIIKAAQNKHIADYKNPFTEQVVQRAFQNFVERNRGSGNIKDNSKIVRTINKIEDANRFFRDIGDMPVNIGRRAGRTVIIYDYYGSSYRVNPNRLVISLLYLHIFSTVSLRFSSIPSINRR